jgi:hypothetical protein
LSDGVLVEHPVKLLIGRDGSDLVADVDFGHIQTVEAVIAVRTSVFKDELNAPKGIPFSLPIFAAIFLAISPYVDFTIKKGAAFKLREKKSAAKGRRFFCV